MLAILKRRVDHVRAKQRAPHATALVLVFAALTLLLLPFCDLRFATAGQGGIAPAVAPIGHGVAGYPEPAAPRSETCCTNIADEMLLKPAEPLIASMPGVPLGAALFLLAELPLFASARQAVKFRTGAPPERSFYVRSARILR